MVDAVFFDIDGTLLSFETHKIPDSTLDALHSLREKGIKLFIATGRHKLQMELIPDLFDFDGYVTLNGQYCFNREGVFRRHSINREDIAVVVEQTKKNRYACHFVEEDRMYVNTINETVEAICRAVDSPLPPVGDPSDALNADIYQLSVFLEKGRQNMLLDSLRHVEATWWHPLFFDAIPLGGGKEKGIEAVLGHYGIPRERTMAFGDGENDVTMLEYVQTGIAMGNAGDAAKRAADYVTDDVDSSGIYNALKHFGIL
ncbi:Cof-type HAD-IIB family hydrolase [Breznakiella homolactica]|uniref:Cof-type HAD-IIB family hydrolase n=1 Tax=Breznakiella homolactica TaxID=2798577 RepID=A0A7T7XPM4_9SPIR|nr:Cof-type HAD-IIB family hydrolase [Breznakiella homolactica]QQO10185.1 Cof-type HAD-IIB family hydrolase [Breznakiella homolactica]